MYVLDCFKQIVIFSPPMILWKRNTNVALLDTFSHRKTFHWHAPISHIRKRCSNEIYRRKMLLLVDLYPSYINSRIKFSQCRFTQHIWIQFSLSLHLIPIRKNSIRLSHSYLLMLLFMGQGMLCVLVLFPIPTALRLFNQMTILSVDFVLNNHLIASLTLLISTLWSPFTLTLSLFLHRKLKPTMLIKPYESDVYVRFLFVVCVLFDRLFSV